MRKQCPSKVLQPPFFVMRPILVCLHPKRVCGFPQPWKSSPFGGWGEGGKVFPYTGGPQERSIPDMGSNAYLTT
jgi:hypothetical protein